LANTNAGSYNCCSCRTEADPRVGVVVGVDVDVTVGGDIIGEPRELEVWDRVDREAGVGEPILAVEVVVVEVAEAVLGEGTEKESRRIFMNTENASSRRAMA
jgi:hypothetical protein